MAEVVPPPVMVEAGGSRFRSDLHAADRVLHGAASGALRGFLADGMCAFFVLHWMRPALNLLVLRFGVRAACRRFGRTHAKRFNQKREQAPALQSDCLF